MQLAEEAAADHATMPEVSAGATIAGTTKPLTSTAQRSDRKEIILAPGEAVEIKVSASEGANITYNWSVLGGNVNFDTHGDPLVKRRGFYRGYGKGKASIGEKAR